MATSLQLSAAQQDTLRALRDNAISRGAAKGAWADFYQYLARVILTQPGMPSVRKGAITHLDVLLARNFLPQDQFESAIWLIGGSQVNSDTGARCHRAKRTMLAKDANCSSAWARRTDRCICSWIARTRATRLDNWRWILATSQLCRPRARGSSPGNTTARCTSAATKSSACSGVSRAIAESSPASRNSTSCSPPSSASP